MQVKLTSILYEGKEYSVGRKKSGADIEHKRNSDTTIDPQAVDNLVIYIQDYISVRHPSLHTFEHLTRRITASDMYRYMQRAVWRNMPGILFDLLHGKDKMEYRMDGDVIGNSIDVKITAVNHKRKMPEVVNLSEKDTKAYLKRYVKEISRYEILPLDSSLIEKAIISWKKELSISSQSAEILTQRLRENIVHYKVKEQPVVRTGPFIYFRCGSVRTIGERYRRNPMPIIDWLDAVMPFLDFVLDFTQYGPKESCIENPCEIAFFAPRVLVNKYYGDMIRVHNLRHALYYACFYELLSPESPLYDEFGSKRVEKTYDTLEDLLIRDRIFEEGMPNFITDDFFWNKNLEFFRKNNSLDDLECRSLLATALYLKENVMGHMYREALTHTKKGHGALMLIPWLTAPVIAGIFGLDAMFVPYVPPAVNGALAAFGHGNLFAYHAVKKKLRTCHTPYEEFYTLATLGNKKN